MIYRKIKDENTGKIKIIPLLHIPPDKEEEFWEKNKDSGLYIKVDLVTAYPDCVKYDETNNIVYKDLKCIHQKRILRKINEYSSYTQKAIEEYLVKMDWGDNYYECMNELNSTLNFVTRNLDSGTVEEIYAQYVIELHNTIEEIWLKEKDEESKIKQTKTYTELLKFDAYSFVKNEVIPYLEKIYQKYKDYGFYRFYVSDDDGINI